MVYIAWIIPALDLRLQGYENWSMFQDWQGPMLILLARLRSYAWQKKLILLSECRALTAL
jgi:hypothetical protein